MSVSPAAVTPLSVKVKVTLLAVSAVLLFIVPAQAVSDSASADAHRKGSGFGIGLSIARSIAEGHHGSIKVKKGTTGVTLVLDGLTLTSENTAAITCGKSSEVTILVSNGTENSLSDTEQNNDDNYPENENAENAVIKCKDGSLVTLCGDGELTITANGKNGIKSGATTDEDGEALLTIRDLTLNIDEPVNDAINAE